jgi:hypothetical protein
MLLVEGGGGGGGLVSIESSAETPGGRCRQNWPRISAFNLFCPFLKILLIGKRGTDGYHIKIRKLYSTSTCARACAALHRHTERHSLAYKNAVAEKGTKLVHLSAALSTKEFVEHSLSISGMPSVYDTQCLWGAVLCFGDNCTEMQLKLFCIAKARVSVRFMQCKCATFPGHYVAPNVF